MFLADVNVLLALAFEAHQHHPPALSWFSSVSDGSCIVCRQVQGSFLRLSSNPVLFGNEALRLSEAWACYDALMADSRLVFALEPPGLDHLWRRLTMVESYSPKVWNNAYLVAFAMAAGLTMVTFDKAFSSVQDLTCLVLSG